MHKINRSLSESTISIFLLLAGIIECARIKTHLFALFLSRFVDLSMKISKSKPFSSTDKVIQYLRGSMNILNRSASSSNELLSSRCSSSCDYDSLSSSSSSMVDSPCQSDTSLSDPVACSSSSNQSFDEDLDFNIGFEQIDDQHRIYDRTNSGQLNERLTILEDVFLRFIDATTIVDQYFRQSSRTTTVNGNLQADNHFKRSPTEFLHDSTYTLCSPNPFSDYTEDEPSTSLSIRYNSFSALPIDDHQPMFVEIKAPKKVVHFADTLVSNTISL